MNIEDVLRHSMTYVEYRTRVDNLLLQGKTTGISQTSELVEYTKLNVQRMNRLDKTINISPEQTTQLKMMSPITWLVIGDAWCGDSAQVIPVLNRMAEASGKNIDLRIISRDDYPQFSEIYRSKSIPKLLFVDNETKKNIASWGPRPEPATDIMLKWKQSEGGISKEDFEKELHLWYSKDRGLTIINELMLLITNLN